MSKFLPMIGINTKRLVSTRIIIDLNMPVIVEAEYLADTQDEEELKTVLKRYFLTEIEEPNEQ